MIALLPAPALAQASEEVVVLGTPLKAPPGTPAYGAVEIDRERLLTEASGRVENALRDVAGFQQFRRSDSRSANPSAQGVTLRALGGNATSRALVLLDGVPIADPFFGYIPFNALVPDQLARARVTRGAGTGPFGAGAVAGVIELESAGRADLAGIAAEADGGGFASTRLTATAAPRLGRGQVTLGGRWERSDGFFTTPRDQRVAATARAAYEDWSVSARPVAALGPRTELQGRLTLFRDDRTLRFQGATSFAQGQDASARLLHRGRWQLDAIAYLQTRDFGNRVISATSFRLTLDQRRTPSTGYGGKLELRPPIGATHLLRVGVDARGAQGQLYEDAYAPSGAVTARRTAGGRTLSLGIYAEDDWTLGRLVLTGGARLDRWTIEDGFFRELSANPIDTRFADRAGTELTGRAGLLWRPTPPLSLRAAGYTGFRSPTLNELYRPFVVFPITTRANAELAPERLRGGELGIDVRLGAARLGVTGFYNRLEGAIGNVTLTPTLRERRNLPAITTRGIEATAEARRGAWSLIASYAYSDARVSAPGALDGRRPAQSPVHAASATLGWARRGWGLSATLRH
ncbi:MAG: TonB-dependent receptor, partial [Sphingomonas sp.]|nr:TonB-dependent receptor [Sphingomonas sp.]